MNNNEKATNQDISNSLEQMKKGQSSSSNQLVFDPATGEFVIAKPSDTLSADATTINSIAQDGFAS